MGSNPFPCTRLITNNAPGGTEYSYISYMTRKHKLGSIVFHPLVPGWPTYPPSNQNSDDIWITGVHDNIEFDLSFLKNIYFFGHCSLINCNLIINGKTCLHFDYATSGQIEETTIEITYSFAEFPQLCLN